MKDKNIRGKIVILSGASGGIGNTLMSEVLLPPLAGTLALLGERFTRLLPAAFPLLDLIGGARMRNYRRRLSAESIKTGK